MAGREAILRKLFGKLGKNPYVEPMLFCGFGYNIQAGDNFFVNNNCVFVDPGKITFGNNVLIAPQCGFYTALHPLDAERRNAFIEKALPITVGDNVWFGGGVKVLPGVTIGSNVVIGAGSVVTKDIPDGVLAYGNPCRVIRTIEPEELHLKGE
jgi:acetyltransferase-like isoleucine patch superfamily enzyme